MTTMGLSPNKDIKELIQLAQEQGWTIVTSGGGHLAWTPPHDPTRKISTSSSPSDYQAINNIKRDLKAAGLIVDKNEWKASERKRRQRRQKDLPYYASNNELLAFWRAEESLRKRMKVPGGLSDAVKQLPDYRLLSNKEVTELREMLNTCDALPDRKCICGTEIASIVGAWKHQQECEIHLAKQQGVPVKRSMKDPPERERIRCPECPEVWFWISQPHLLSQHMAVEHGKQPCPWCHDYFRTNRGGLHRHVNACPKRPENLKLSDAEMVPLGRQAIPPRRDPVTTTDGRVGERGEQSAFSSDSSDVPVADDVLDLTDPQPEPQRAPNHNGAGVAVNPPPVVKAPGGPPPTKVKNPDVIAPDRRPAPQVNRSSQASDDELWVLLEMVLDGPVVVSRESFGVINK